MTCGIRFAWIVAVLLALVTAGCDAAGDGIDPGAGFDLPRDGLADTVADGAALDARDVAGELPGDAGLDATADAAPADPGDADPDDWAIPDEGEFPDPGPFDVPPQDPGAEADTPPVPDTFCRSFDQCKADEVCEFSLGACQKRGTWKDTAIEFYAFHPAAAAPGDWLVLDGTAFFIPTGLFGGSPKSVKIGSMNTQFQADENRILVKVTTANMKGVITVTDAAGKPSSLPTPFQQAPAGVIPCDGTTPAASGVPGADPRHVGPYAAGYVDLNDDLQTRVFYPAACGSIRRPPVAGTWPLVMIMHGNGALHLNHEHLGQLLATWGFVSVMPATMHNMANQEQQALVDQVMPLVVRVRGKHLGDVNPILDGVVTTEDVAWVGHSRGTGRSEELILADSDIAAHTKGAIFLGPVDDGEAVPGILMVFGGGKDSQSTPGNYNGPYNDHDGPKWLVTLPGGNHGSFCDHKVYGYGILGGMGDQQPTITRHKQLTVVQTFGLPMMQRAFGLDEPFADVLDEPPVDPVYTVKHEE